MGTNKQQKNRSRRGFFSSLLSGNEETKGDMVKMLTPDGKLVEVSKAVLEAASQKKRSSNKDIYDWMKNPSKDKE